MRFELFVAARYLRAKRRQAVISVITLISVIGVAAGVASLVIALAINNGFTQDLHSRLLSSTAHIQLLRTRSDGISNWQELMARLSRQPHVVAASPVIYEEVLGTRGSLASGMVLKGIIPADEDKVTDFLKSVKIGSASALDPVPEPKCPPGANCPVHKEIPPIILGKDLASSLGASLNSIITAISPQGDLTPFGPAPKYQRFKVVGIFDSGFYDYDSTWAFIRLADAQRLYTLGDVVVLLEFKLDDRYKAREVANELVSKAGSGFSAITWMEQNVPLFHALKLEGVVTFLTIGLIVLVAALNILISLIMMVMEKTKDIAVLMSMGARRGQIRRIFILQGVLIGLVGTVVGLIVGYAISLAGAHYRFIPLSAEVYSIDHVPFAPRLWHGVIIAAVALLVSFVATLYPSWSAARVLPAEALRYE